MISGLEVVRSFWSDDAENNLKLLEHLVESREPGADSFLLELFIDPVKRIGDRAAEILLLRNPWLKLTAHPIAEQPDDLQGDEYSRVWEELKQGVDQFVRNHGNNYERYTAFTHFPSLHQVLYDSLIKQGFSDTAEKFARDADLKLQYRRKELLFAPTYRCNLSCSYCYAKNWHKKFHGDAKLEDVEELIDWMKKQGLNTLSLAGGEPTIYSKLSELIALVRTNGLRLNVATNMLFSNEVEKLLQPEFVDMVTAHYDQSYLTSQRDHQKYCSNLSLIINKGIPFRIRYTLTSESNPLEWQKIFGIVEQFEVGSLHFAPTFMNFDANNIAAVSEDGTTSKALSIFTGFCDEALERNISLHLCKPIALCLFPKEKLRKYLLKNVLRNACVAMDAHCSRNITVNPDLSMFPCNALAKTGPRVTSFATIEEAGGYYKDYIEELMRKKILPECGECFFYYSGFCQQVCLVEKHHLG